MLTFHIFATRYIPNCNSNSLDLSNRRETGFRTNCCKCLPLAGADIRIAGPDMALALELVLEKESGSTNLGW